MSSSINKACLNPELWAMSSMTACMKLTFSACLYGPVLNSPGAQESRSSPSMHVDRFTRLLGMLVSQPRSDRINVWSTRPITSVIWLGKTLGTASTRLSTPTSKLGHDFNTLLMSVCVMCRIRLRAIAHATHEMNRNHLRTICWCSIRAVKASLGFGRMHRICPLE